MFLTEWLYEGLGALAYPQPCAICSHSVEHRKYGVICEACWTASSIFTGTETICWKCGLLSQTELSPDLPEQVRCRRCDSHFFSAARAVGLYEGALRESVLLLKRQPNLSRHVADLLSVTAIREPLRVSTRIIPVPLHPKRMRARGFNQASIIARAVSKSLKLPLDEVSLLRVSASEKYRAGLDAKARLETVAGAFQVLHPRLVANENILLVDDVFTTGATVSACSEALVAAGARSVMVLTIARART